MKILFVGLGSIGSRHLRNSVAVLQSRGASFDIFALRTTAHQLAADISSYIQKSYWDISELPNDFDVAFITNPTSLHFSTIQSLKAKATHLFIEKPIFESLSYNIEKIRPSAGSQYYVACPLRHTRLFQTAQKVCQSLNVRSIRAICSSYLPEWRPNINYRNTYSAQLALGGGVDLDLIHELDYLTALFSFPSKIYSVKGKYSNLEIDCCDTACYLGQYSEKTLELHLDYFGRFNRREVEIFTDDDVITVDFTRQEIRYHIANKHISCKEARDSWCQRELSYFFDLCQGKELQNVNDIFRAYKVLQLALGAW